MAVKYDPTINLGHILTFVGFIATGAGAYSVLEKRVSLLEEKSMTALQALQEQRAEQKEGNRELRADVKDVQRTVNDLSRTLSSSPPLPVRDRR